MNKLIVASLTLLLFCSCVTYGDMPLRKGMKPIDLEKGSIALFFVKTSKNHKPDVKAVARFVDISDGKSPTRYQFPLGRLDWRGRSNEFFGSVQVEPGTYVIESIMGGGGDLRHPEWGNFKCPINATFEVLPKEVVYVGTIDLRCRKRRDGEPRAGGVIPIIDQAVSGFSSGTWDVEIKDRGTIDIPEILKKFPDLKQFEIQKRVMDSPSE